MSFYSIATTIGAVTILFVTTACEPVRVQEHVAIRYIGSEPITEPAGADCWQWLRVELPYKRKSGEAVELLIDAHSQPDDWVSPKNNITVFTIPGEIDKVVIQFKLWRSPPDLITGLYPPHAKLIDVSGNQFGIAPLAEVSGTTGWYITKIINVPIEGARLELPTFAFQIENKNYRWKPSGYLLLTPTEDSVRICA